MATDPFASDELFRLAFHASPDSVNINRLRDGVYVDINQGFTDLTGYTRAEVIGRSSLEISIWADLSDRERLVEGWRRDGFMSNLEARFRLKDGRVGVGLMSARVVTMRGEPHILSITRDITERKRTEDQLREAHAALEDRERLSRALFESAAHANLVSCGGVLTDVNAQALQMFHETRDQLLGTREDDEAVRRLQERVLSGRGYRVVTAPSPTAAEQAFARLDGEVDLLITDVVMPVMNGRQLAERLTARAPALKVLYVSGYTENAIVHAGVLDAGISFLAKPCAPAALLIEVRRILDGAARQ